MAEQPTRSDGGTTALSGFLYQMLVALALKGHGCAKPDAEGISALLALAEDATVLHEGYDSDVALLLRGVGSAALQGVVFVQCKFSKSGAGSPIAPKEFKEILDRLYAAAKTAYKEGKKLGGFFLVTNRVYSPNTLKICEATDAGTRSKDLNRIQNCVAAKMCLCSEVETAFWDDQLRQYADEYGILSDEYSKGRASLLGGLLACVTDSPECPVSTEMLANCLAGSADAKRITHTSMARVFDSALRELGPSPAHTVVDRPSAESMLNQHQNRAIILCTGAGGTGKTAALRKWAARETKARFVASRRPARVTDSWLSVQINEWRGLPERTESPDAALLRVKVANPHMPPPLVLLCLDGVDERITVGSNTHHLCSLLEWFWGEDERVRQNPGSAPRARLIVTCRRLEDFDHVWFPNTSGSPELESERPPVISFEDFSGDEFAAVLRCERAGLGEAVHARLLQTTSSPVVAADSEDLGDDRNLNLRLPPDSPEMILRHPAMWEAFTKLCPARMEAFLDGEVAAEDEVAGHYLGRFFRKSADRSEVLTENTIRLAFRKIAEATYVAGARTKHGRATWHEVLVAGVGLGAFCTETLFMEALSSGIIADDYDSWVWRFAFIHRYLAGGGRAS